MSTHFFYHEGHAERPSRHVHRSPRLRVVIVGAGFGGLNAARMFRGKPVFVTVIDRSNHHLFQPLLYQVATAALNPADIAAPIRRILGGQSNAEVVLAEVASIDVPGKRVLLKDGEVPYDVLILAAGASHSYFGNDDWSAHAPGLKSLSDALNIRKRLLLAFEIAEREPDVARRRAWMTFVIVGGGPTGVELAGTLAEVARKTLARDFRHIDPASARIILLNSGDRILAAFPDDLSEKARRQLVRLGVQVRRNMRVTGIDAEGVTVGSGDNALRIEARTVLWAAGVQASPLARSLGVPLDRSGRVMVRPDLTIPDRDDIYVIGDLVHLAQEGRLIPGVAPAAVQQGKHAARNILRSLSGQPRLPFRYVNKGNLATIGRAAAVAKIGKVHLSGFTAWLLWLFVHVLFLIGFRNRLLVMIQWAWSYVTYDRGARLITDRTPGPLVPGHEQPEDLYSAEHAGLAI